MTNRKNILLALTCLFVIALTVGLGVYNYAAATLPSIKKLDGCFTTSMNKVYLCSDSETYSKLREVSPYLKNAILVSEDVGFYNHAGFDLHELKESFITNLLRLKFARGGSTISQQMVKNTFLTPTKSIIRKIQEAIITSQIEDKYSKDLIFEKYLNVVQFGEDLYGIKSASLYYFSKQPSELSVVESAFLAYLLPSPVKYSRVFRTKEFTAFSRQRLADIVYKLHFFKMITDDEYEVAKGALLSL